MRNGKKVESVLIIHGNVRLLVYTTIYGVSIMNGNSVNITRVLSCTTRTIIYRSTEISEVYLRAFLES